MSSTSQGGEGLSHRLNRLRSFFPGQGNVWDIGCDHAQLGLSFLNDPVDSIHLVDSSAPVVANLQHVLNKINDASYITKRNIFITYGRGQDLKVKAKQNTFFIAGMGGKEIGEIVTALLPQLDETSRFVISPHRKILELRTRLGHLPLSLAHEEVIAEDNQFYQILVLTPGAGPGVHPFGERIWTGATGEEYCSHQLRFFDAHRDEASRAFVRYLKTLKSSEC
jgi:tRNA (adenine22-N1)-methyltransferase